MPNNSIESLVIGCSIALGVLLVHGLTQGASGLVQLLALLGVGLVLFCIQLVLAQFRARRGDASPEQQNQPRLPFRSLRGRRGNPFARELTHDWTGLEDHSVERDLAGPYAPDDLDDELWGEHPQAPARKSIAKQVDDAHQQ
jgi:hypothetical protein